MKKLHFDRTRLAAYSGMAAALFAAEKTDAQIAYTDISPNIIMDNMGSPSYLTEMIDLNNDGTADLEITSHFFVHWSSSNVYVSSSGYVIKAEMKHENKVFNSGGFFGCACSVQANSYGYMLSSHRAKWHWKKSGYLSSYFEPSPSWGDGQEHYMGIKLIINDSTHYGWVRLKIFDAYPVEILDYAYNMVPNQSIATGQTLPCGDPFEQNNHFSTAKPVQTDSIYHGLIDVATDDDFFKWTYTADPLNPNVQISLLNMPENYNLKLFDSTKTQIALSKNKGRADERIFYNGTLASGTYFIKVYPKSSMKFDPVNCYTLQIESRSTPYQRIAESGITEPEITSIKVFPNPANDRITFQRTGGFIADVKIMDVTGREVMSSHPGTELASVTIDIANLPAGTYFARLTGSDDVIATKFIVQK